MSGRDVRRLLEDHSLVFVRQRGSPMIMQRRFPTTTNTVPVPDHRVLRIGTLMSIIRQCQLARELFEKGH